MPVKECDVFQEDASNPRLKMLICCLVPDFLLHPGIVMHGIGRDDGGAFPIALCETPFQLRRAGYMSASVKPIR